MCGRATGSIGGRKGRAASAYWSGLKGECLRQQAKPEGHTVERIPDVVGLHIAEPGCAQAAQRGIAHSHAPAAGQRRRIGHQHRHRLPQIVRVRRYGQHRIDRAGLQTALGETTGDAGPLRPRPVASAPHGAWRRTGRNAALQSATGRTPGHVPSSPAWHSRAGWTGRRCHNASARTSATRYNPCTGYAAQAPPAAASSARAGERDWGAWCGVWSGCVRSCGG